MEIPKLELKSAIGREIDAKEMFLRAAVDVNKKIERQPIAISIGESTYKQSRYPIPFGSYGDFSCMVGSSKAKKTFLKSAIIAGYIGGRSNYPQTLIDMLPCFVLNICYRLSIAHRGSGEVFLERKTIMRKMSACAATYSTVQLNY